MSAEPQASEVVTAGAGDGKIQAPAEGTYIAALWEHPTLCLAIFGVQFHTEEGQRRYEASGINDEMFPALEAAAAEGLLLTRPLTTPEGPILMQYWRSYEDLDRWSRKMPHTRWWRWLLENAGEEVSFYHEIYQARAAEAIFETGCRPVGPALFCQTEAVKSGEGRSRQRQQRFADAAADPQDSPGIAERSPGTVYPGI